MKILVINAGSSSLKYQLIDMANESVMAKGNCERIGISDGIVKYKNSNGVKKEILVDMKNHTEAFMKVKDLLLDKEIGVISELSEVSAVGHRIVQGGCLFDKSVIIDKSVIEGIESLIPLAPLHNSAHIQGIMACIEVFGKNVPQVAVFDTSFHSTMPPKAYMYPIPYEYYEKYNVRRYGFHGTSHRYVSNRCAELMGKDIKDLKIISCHLGNGSSITAIDRGKVLDTSMGLTPLDGFMMGTRTGALDPSVVTFIAEKEKMSPSEMNELLNRKSGMLGISGISSDDRDIENAIASGNKRAKLAHQMLVYEIIKFIGAYVAALDGCDAIIFTAGLGENNYCHRKNICENLSYLGVEIDNKINEQAIHGKEAKISKNTSKVDIYVIPTNEEIVIARDTEKLVEGVHGSKN